MRKVLWAIYIGAYYTDGGFDERAFRTKKGAEKELRSEGYKWNSEQELFLRDDDNTPSGGYWARIEEMEFVDK